MEIISCKACGRLFNYMQGDRICPDCQKKMDEKFVEVKKFVKENPRVDINVLSAEMDVSIRQIKRWIREERLCFTDESPIGLNCESCGAIVKTGRFCKACKDKMASRLQGAVGVSPAASNPTRSSKDNKMRFLT